MNLAMGTENVRNIVRSLLSEDYDHRAYLKWKRKNVSFRGMRDTTKENGGGAMLGAGLYTASLSNKSMARQYGEVYYVVNAVPKNPKVFDTLNDWEIWFGNVLVMKYTPEGERFPNRKAFNEQTTIDKAMREMGYDGVMIKGREMVNFDPPENIYYYRNEDQVISHWQIYVRGKEEN